MPWSSADIKALQKIEGSDQYSSTRKLIQDLDEVLISFEAAEREKIIAARDLSLLVHIEQQDRPDGQPYVNHPLKVALNVARKFGFTSSDAIAASLLHDSVEDQPDRLLELLQGVPSGMKNIEQEALRLIGEYSGAKVSDMVARLTNPDFKEMVVQARQAGDPRTTEGLTIEFYKAHFLEIMEKDPEVFLIKLGDFAENAFALNKLVDGSRKDWLRAKYGPVIVSIQKKLAGIPDKGHVLSRVKESLTTELAEVYARDYAVTQ